MEATIHQVEEVLRSTAAVAVGGGTSHIGKRSWAGTHRVLTSRELAMQRDKGLMVGHMPGLRVQVEVKVHTPLAAMINSGLANSLHGEDKVVSWLKIYSFLSQFLSPTSVATKVLQ